MKSSVDFEGTRDFVVVYKQQVNLEQQLRTEVQKGNRIEDRYASSVNGALLELEADDVNRLRRDDRLLAIERDRRVSIAGQAQGTRSAASWGLDRIDQRDLPLDGSISTLLAGDGVENYILDTGVRLDHTQFTGRINPEGFSAFSGGWNDCHGHGTHVAGTVAGSTYGVAPAARVTAVRVLDCDGAGSLSSVVGGIDWVISDHLAGEAAVANMSLGGGRSDSINLAVQRAVDDGITMVVAAGNESSDACNRSPASAPNAVTVGSTTSSDQMSDFSNHGRCVDIFAPGTSITSAWHTSSTASNTISGTSMAAPHVAGVASLLLAGNTDMDPAAVSERLVASSTPGRMSGLAGCTANLLAYAGSGSDLPPPPPSSGGPANDNFVDRENLSTLSGVSGTSFCATKESGEPSHGTGSIASIWYTWIAPQNGTLTLRTQGSNYDTLLAAYTGSSVGSLVQQAQNDDSGVGLWSQISFPVTRGTAYQIAIDGFGGASGNTVLSGSFSSSGGGGVLLPPNIDSGPPELTNSTSASLAFAGEAGATFECQLNSGAWESCISPRSYSGLEDDSHTFRVRQTDGTGNTSEPANWNWTVDTEAPSAPSITSGPLEVTNSASASFGFSREASATLECRLNSGHWESCASPRSYSGLEDASHIFRVRQTDGAGNTSEPANWNWTVDTEAPSAPSITLGPAERTSLTFASIAFSGEVGASFECRLNSGSWESCTSPQSYSSLKGPYTFRVKQTDGAGNTSEPATWNWTVETESGGTFDPSIPEPKVTVTSLRAKLTKAAGLVTSRVTVSGQGKIAQRATTGKGSKARTWCRASKTVRGASTHSLQCNLGSKGRKAIRKGALKLTLRTTFTPTVGKAVTVDRKLTVNRRL